RSYHGNREAGPQRGIRGFFRHQGGISLKMATAEANHEEEERGKVFLWAREKRTWIYLTAFFLFSILIHGAGFYLFKVVYPSPVGIAPRPDAITILDASNPAVRSVLQRISDRTIFLLPPSSQSDVRVRLENHPVRFTPAFQRTQLELREPPHPAALPGVIEPLPPEAERADADGPARSIRVKFAPSL